MRDAPLFLSLKEYYRALFNPVDMRELPNQYIETLPDSYWKKPEGNNNRILSLAELAMVTLHQDIAEIEDMVDLDQVTGQTLNLYGQMLDVARGKFNDTQYRTLIKAQIACNLSKGDFISVLSAIRMFLGCDTEYVRLDEIPDENCAVKVDTIPYTILEYTGLSVKQVMKLIKRLVPAGVRIEELLFEGTFELGESATVEYDEKRGFGNVEQTTGGYFGSVMRGDVVSMSLPDGMEE